MRRLLALVLPPLLALGSALALAAPAGAGGPTSVLITDHGSGRAAALLYSDARYTELEDLLSRSTALDAEPSGQGDRSLTITWLIHDVEPWRTQTLFPDADGGPVVATYGTAAMGSAGEVTWSRVGDAAALTAVLARILRPSTASDPGGQPAAPGADATPAATPAATPPTASTASPERTETAWFSLTGWRWLLPGLALGAAAALLARRRADAEPRRVLSDTAPDDTLVAPR